MKRSIIVLGCVLFLALGTVCPAAAENMVSQDLTVMKQRLENRVGGMWDLRDDNRLHGKSSDDETKWACTIIPNPKMSDAGLEVAGEVSGYAAVQFVFAFNDFYMLIGTSNPEAPALQKIEETLKMEAVDPPNLFGAFVTEQCDCSWDEEGFRLSRLKRNAESGSPRLGIYLVEKTADDLEKAELAPRPVLSEADIVSYDWKTHTMEITDAAQKRLEVLAMLLGGHGKPFVVVADGERCYLGGFWTPESSIRPPYPLIYLYIMTVPHAVVIEEYLGADSRFDVRVAKTLSDLNKLKPPAASDVMIQYTHAGLTGVKVGRGKLHFSWHTGRRPFDEHDSSPMRQSLEAYDSHAVGIWLTEEEVEAFAKWVEDNRILELEAEYPEPEEKTYASAFESSLFVALGKKKYSLSWTGDTEVPDSLHKAINELVGICHGIRKSRDRSRADASIPNGRLGYQLGTCLTIEGVRVDKGKAAARTLHVDTVNGKKLSSRPNIWIENAEFQDLPAGTRCVFKGYESGKMIGVPRWVLKAENGPGPQAPWQFHRYFIVTTVVEPESLEKN